MAGILLLLIGLDAVAAEIERTRLSAWAGLMFLKVALVLQASKVVGQLLFEPSIASHPESAFLLRDAVMLSDPAVVAFRLVSSITLLFGAAMFGAALYRSGAFPKSAVAMIGGGALIYVAGFFVSVFIAVAGVIMLAIGCVLVGVRLWDLSEGS